MRLLKDNGYTYSSLSLCSRVGCPWGSTAGPWDRMPWLLTLYNKSNKIVKPIGIKLKNNFWILGLVSPNPGSKLIDDQIFTDINYLLITETYFFSKAPKKDFQAPGEASNRKEIILYRVPEFLSSRLNWVPPSLPNLCQFVSPQDPRRGDTLAFGRGGGGTQFRQLDRNSRTLYV
jgi:hypothetical protein